MKKKSEQDQKDDMLPEYDFTTMKRGERGKFYQQYRAGHSVKIYKEDGTVEMHQFTLDDGVIMLEPDVRQYFPDSKTVNDTLRSLIALIPKQQKVVQ